MCFGSDDPAPKKKVQHKRPDIKTNVKKSKLYTEGGSTKAHATAKSLKLNVDNHSETMRKKLRIKKKKNKQQNSPLNIPRNKGQRQGLVVK